MVCNEIVKCCMYMRWVELKLSIQLKMSINKIENSKFNL